MIVGWWRRRAAGSALVTSMALGLRDTLDPEGRDAERIEVDAWGEDAADPLIELHFHPWVPALTWVVVHAGARAGAVARDR